MDIRVERSEFQHHFERNYNQIQLKFDDEAGRSRPGVDPVGVDRFHRFVFIPLKNGSKQKQIRLGFSRRGRPMG